MIILILLYAGDFAISSDIDDQHYSRIIYAYDQYYVFWQDQRFYPPDKSIFGARVTNNGLLVDSIGKQLFRDRTVLADVACDGLCFLVTIQDSC